MAEKSIEKRNADSRREFLRKSAFAACATPVIMNMLVEKASAFQSNNPGKVASGNKAPADPTSGEKAV